MSWKQHRSIQIYRSFDLGYSPDPAYCVWIAHLGNRYIAFKEKLWYKTIAQEIAKDMVLESEGMKVSMTYCDPTMDIKTAADVRSIKDIFEDNGVPMEASINNREHYAHAVHSALAEEVNVGDDQHPVILPKLQIYKQGCPYLIKTLPQQRYDPKHPLRMADNKNDHAVIALAYFLISSGSFEHKTTSTALWKIPKWMRPKETNKLIRDN